MRILLAGRNGQIGYELERALAPFAEVIAADRAILDLTHPETIRSAVRNTRPHVIVNAAAYTAVDKAESEPDLAMQVNAAAPGVFAEEAARHRALLVHYSTDYVFDGRKSSPYVENDAANPINEYGRSKLEGERRILAAGCRHLIFRTSWVFGARGRNFLLAILRAAGERPELRVVDDQLGAPTSSIAIAQATARILRSGHGPDGVYHMSAAGETTWFGFAQAILARAGLHTPVIPVRSDQYPTAAARPRNSRLDNARLSSVFDLALPDWQTQLEQVTSELVNRGVVLS